MRQDNVVSVQLSAISVADVGYVVDADADSSRLTIEYHLSCVIISTERGVYIANSLHAVV